MIAETQVSLELFPQPMAVASGLDGVLLSNRAWSSSFPGITLRAALAEKRALWLVLERWLEGRGEGLFEDVLVDGRRRTWMFKQGSIGVSRR